MNQISPYYAHFIRGATLTKSNSIVNIRLAVENLEKCLEYKKTEEAYEVLARCYILLHKDDLYEKTILRASEDGFISFYSSCGLYYANSKEKADKEKALCFYMKGMDAGSPRAYADLAKLYISGCNAFEPNREKGLECLRKGLKLNDSKWNGYFYWALGLAFFEDEEYEKAIDYYQKAIKFGYLQANYNLAMMYRDGKGVEENPEKYMELLMNNLSKESALEIAGVFLLGKYTPMDEQIAFMYLDYAAKQGSAVGAVMAAAYMIQKGNYNENVINQYLEVAFKNGATDENMKEHYDAIEEALGESVRKKVEELASKYWNLRKEEA